MCQALTVQWKRQGEGEGTAQEEEEVCDGADGYFPAEAGAVTRGQSGPPTHPYTHLHTTPHAGKVKL